MKRLRRLYFKIFKTYRILERQFVTYEKANEMLKRTEMFPEDLRWQLAPEEDWNLVSGFVYLCRKERIWQ